MLRSFSVFLAKRLCAKATKLSSRPPLVPFSTITTVLTAGGALSISLIKPKRSEPSFSKNFPSTTDLVSALQGKIEEEKHKELFPPQKVLGYRVSRNHRGQIVLTNSHEGERVEIAFFPQFYKENPRCVNNDKSLDVLPFDLEISKWGDWELRVSLDLTLEQRGGCEYGFRVRSFLVREGSTYHLYEKLFNLELDKQLAAYLAEQYITPELCGALQQIAANFNGMETTQVGKLTLLKEFIEK